MGLPWIRTPSRNSSAALPLQVHAVLLRAVIFVFIPLYAAAVLIASAEDDVSLGLDFIALVLMTLILAVYVITAA
jgi:hypothetical protein